MLCTRIKTRHDFSIPRERIKKMKSKPIHEKSNLTICGSLYRSWGLRSLTSDFSARGLYGKFGKNGEL